MAPIVRKSLSIKQPWRSDWLLLFVCVLLFGLYYMLRSGGLWTETDTAVFNGIIHDVAESGQLVPPNGSHYTNGYTYPALATFLLATTGLDVVELQQYLVPLLAALVVLPAWALYRELSGSARGATLATILLFIQPEFLFVIFRGSHEKFTRALMLVCLLLLVRSLNLRSRPGLLTAHVSLFYLAAFALVSSNNLLAHSFIGAIALALLAALVIERRSGQSQATRYVQRLMYVTITSLLLVYLVMFYVYTPSQSSVRVLANIYERMSALVLDVEAEAQNAYSYVSFGWINTPVYFLVSIANWLILLGSLAIWLYQAYRWLRLRAPPASQATRLLWLLYGALALQGALSIVADLSGAIGNLQHRLFPSFAIVAVALVGNALAAWKPTRLQAPLRSGLAALIACIAVLSLFKASNEPLLSNKWTFYRSSEVAALAWSDQYFQQEQIWVEFDERLSVVYRGSRDESERPNTVFGDPFPSDRARVRLLSDVTRMRATRLGQSLPIPPDAARVYDNGTAQFFRLRPQTPIQR